jgi:hypothetical protein
MMNSSLVDRSRIRHGRRNLFGTRRSARPRLERLEGRTLLSTWTVTDNSDSPTDPGSLRYAIRNAPSGTTIDFAPTVGSMITLTNGTLNITTNLDIEGPSGYRLAINGNANGSVFGIASGKTVAISELSIGNGKAISGGGIDNGGTLTLSGCTISDNTATSGGGGIFNNGTLTINNSTLSKNVGGYGGGIVNNSGATVTNCTLSFNTSADSINPGYSGGAIDNYGTLSLVNCTVANNEARYTGGIENRKVLTIVNSTISHNKGNYECGGVFNSGSVSLANTIIALNIVTDTSFGGVPDVDGTVNSLGYNLIGNTKGINGWVSTDLHNVDPKLAPLGNNGGPTQTMALMPGSPALNAGSASIPGVAVPKIDQRGALRGPAGLDAGDSPDIGAFESSSSYLVTMTSDSNVVGTLRAAVNWANLNVNVNKPKPVAIPTPPVPNTILFDTKGAFSQPQTIALSPGLGPLTLTNTSTGETIAGPGASIVTVSGGGKVRVIDVSERAITMITGLTISGGHTDSGSGAGILIQSFATVTLTNSTVSNNSASSGGGIGNDGALTLVNCAVSGNSSISMGAGIVSHGAATLTNCTVSGNVARFAAGGIYSQTALTLTNSNVTENSADASGGGIVNVGAATLTNCTVAGNSSGSRGGGILNDGTLTLTNSTVAGNSSGLRNRPEFIGGGGIINYDTLTLTNSTVSGNSDPKYGGGVYNANPGFFGSVGTVTLDNTIIAGNRLTGPDGSGPDVNGPFQSLGHNLIGNTAGSTGWVSSDLLNVDPNLRPLASNGGPTQTMALMPGSPAAGAGDVSFVKNPPFPGPPFTDQRGLARIVSGKVDIGAFQSQAGVSPAVAKPVAVKGHPVRTAKVVPIFSSPKTLTLVLSSRRLLSW